MKRSLSVILGFIMIFTMLPPGAFAVSAKEDILYSDFYSIEDSYYNYVEPSGLSKAATRSNYSGGVQAISDAIVNVEPSVDISA